MLRMATNPSGWDSSPFPLTTFHRIASSSIPCALFPKGGRQRGMQPNSVMQGRETSKPQRQWPAPPGDPCLHLPLCRPRNESPYLHPLHCLTPTLCHLRSSTYPLAEPSFFRNSPLLLFVSYLMCTVFTSHGFNPPTIPSVSAPLLPWIIKGVFMGPADETKLVNREAQRREIDQENERIARKLEERYKSRKDSFVVANDVRVSLCRILVLFPLHSIPLIFPSSPLHTLFLLSPHHSDQSVSKTPLIHTVSIQPPGCAFPPAAREGNRLPRALAGAYFHLQGGCQGQQAEDSREEPWGRKLRGPKDVERWPLFR